MPDKMLRTGAERVDAGAADSMEQHRCGRFGCSNTFLRKRVGRPREFCSEKCRRLNWTLRTRGDLARIGNDARPRHRDLIADLTTAIGLLARAIEAIEAIEQKAELRGSFHHEDMSGY